MLIVNEQGKFVNPENEKIWRKFEEDGTDCHVGALPLLAMTGRGIDKDLKAGIIMGKRGRCSDWVSPSCGYEVTAGL